MTRLFGCLLSIISAIILLGVVLLGWNTISVDNISTELLIVTLEPASKSFPFAVENNEIIYIQGVEGDGIQCNYSIRGAVFDLNGEPYQDFQVEVEQIDDQLRRIRGGASGPLGENTSNWSMWLPTSPLDYEIWLVDLDDNQISQRVLVSPQPCTHNEAIVNFVQVVPIPND